MFEQKKIFTKEFDDIYDLAVKLAHVNSKDWDATSPSDPALTILETFSVLKDMQQAYMESVNDKCTEKLLKILVDDIKTAFPTKYIANLTYSDDMPFVIPSDSFVYEDMKLSVCEYTSITDVNKIKLINTKNEKIQNISFPLQVEREVDLFGSLEEDNVFYILIDAINLNKNINLFLDINDEKRVKIPNDKYKFSTMICELSFYGYCNDDSGKVVECELDILREDTYGFLYSGLLNLSTDKKLVKGGAFDEDVYYIKCVMKDCKYDVIPKIKNIYANPIELYQQNNLIKSFRENYSDVSDDSSVTMCIVDKVAFEGKIVPYILVNDKYIDLKDDDFKIYRDIKTRFVEIVISVKNIKSRLDSLNVYDKEIKSFEILAVAYDKVFYNVRSIGSGDGTANQKFNLPFKNYIKDKLEILVKEKDVYYKYKRVDEIARYGKYDRVYELNSDDNIIKFGDGYCGRCVPIGNQNIIIVNFITTHSELNGISKSEKIFDTQSDEMMIKFSNIVDVNTIYIIKQNSIVSNLNNLKNKLAQSDIFERTLVTKEDYINLIMNFPAILVNDVKVYSNENNGFDIEVYVDFKAENSRFVKFYIDNLMDYIRKYKLITVKCNIHIKYGLKVK